MPLVGSRPARQGEACLGRAAFGAPDVGGTPPCAASRTDVLTQIAGRATLLCDSLAPLGSLQARDGSTLTWAGDAPAAASPGAPRAITIRVSPVRPGHSVTLEHRVKGGLVTEQVARPELRPSAPGERVFKAVLPAAPDGLVEFLPVLRFAGQPISPRLADAPGRPGSETTSRERETSSASARTRAPVWNWNARFLASLQATVLEQKVGKVPDGLRVNWRIDEGRLSGPYIDGVVLAGSGDWMRIRPDGVAVVDVRACLQTTDGARIAATYGGVLDLGSDGYDRALRGDFVPFPPLAVAPTFETPDYRLSWLNRLQCLGVGRVDTTGKRYDFDVYAVEVGDRRLEE
jgi:Protein of unknown function (DUF3237)